MRNRRALAGDRRRRGWAASALGLALVVGLSGCMNSGQGETMAAMNADRVANHLRALPENPTATTKAQAWALHLSKIGTLAHSRLADGFEHVNWCMLGENVGYGGTPQIIERAYMASPGHRRNILDPHWDSAGVGYRLGACLGTAP